MEIVAGARDDKQERKKGTKRKRKTLSKKNVMRGRIMPFLTLAPLCVSFFCSLFFPYCSAISMHVLTVPELCQTSCSLLSGFYVPPSRNAYCCWITMQGPFDDEFARQCLRCKYNVHFQGSFTTDLRLPEIPRGPTVEPHGGACKCTGHVVRYRE
jgi:hypothetical protein